MIITYLVPPNSSRTFASDASEVSIGRFSPSQPVDLDLNPDQQVSHLHARITCEDGKCWIEDLQSRNGTWVNGRQISTRTLVTPEDRVQIGQTTLVVTAASGDSERDATITDESATDGVFKSRLMSAELPSVLILPEETDRGSGQALLQLARKRLTAFYDLGAALGTTEGLEPMLRTIVRHMLEAIPGAQRGALLLRDGDRLLLRAHIPEGDPAASLSLGRQAVDRKEGFIWQFADSGNWVDPSMSIIDFGTRCAMYAPMIRMGEVLGVVCVDNSAVGNAFEEDDLRLLMAMANHAAMFVKNHLLQQDLQRETTMRSNLLRQFSPGIAERLMQEKGRLRLGGQRADPVTILVSDVRGFTAHAANLDPDDVVQMLNQMFAVLTPIVFNYDGTVDKFVGDSVLGVFGSPEPDDRQCEKAVRAALEMQEALGKLGDVWRIGGLPIWQMGIGVHTGEVVHGFIGSPERMEYTVIGDTVNRAARYCDGAAPGEVLISPAVYQSVFRLITVVPKVIQTKHPETEPDLDAYIVKGARGTVARPTSSTG